jgi:NADPH-dependent glutamate synthase beta subunit-like oxidoreductase/coenzyme F420-reducing hydrogenase delta subunit
VHKGALVIGGSPAGIQAALDLAHCGNDVHLVEPYPFVGNGSQSMLPRHLFNTRILELAKHPRVTLWTHTIPIQVKREADSFGVQLRQHPRFVDLDRCTGCGDCVEACPVTIAGTSRKAVYLAKDSQPECATIDRLGRPPCTDACPGGIHVQGYIALIAQKRFQEALDLIREAIPFPSICGRICTHPCELNCRRSQVDEPVAIRQLKRFVADWESANAVEFATKQNNVSPPAADAKQVAVVGSGPAGMTAADRLVRLGYGVTVFEKSPAPAGMLAVGIPAYRLPRNVIAREYRRIQQLGVEIRLNTVIGNDGDYTIKDLFDAGYDAVCLAIGAHKSLTPGIPGENLPGVVFGIELLKTINLWQQRKDPACKNNLQKLLRRGVKTRVAVLGGGNTAMDVARSLKRFGIRDVQIVYRRSRNEMPALAEEVADTELEAIAINFLTAPTRILGDQKKGVSGVECVRMQLGRPDASGRQRPVPMSGTEFEMALDMVVLAIGQIPDVTWLQPLHGLKLTRDQRIQVDEMTFATDLAGVFAVGDAVTRDKMSAIEAIGMGKQVARAIDAYLKDPAPDAHSQPDRDLAVSHREMLDAELVPKPRIPAPTLPLDQRLKSFAEVEQPFTEKQAQAEARRCLACGPCSECQACVRVCKPNAVVFKQRETTTELKAGAIIYAGDPDGFSQLNIAEDHGIYRVPPGDALMGSAAAAHAMSNLPGSGFTGADKLAVKVDREPVRIGVFICQCGDAISKTVDTEAVRRQTAGWKGVVRSQVLPFSCSPEAAKQISDSVQAHELNRVTLAACACCSLGQVCFSCSFQRIRCKQFLGVFKDKAPTLLIPDRGTLSASDFEFVNIREQCAWVHGDDPRAATAKAAALVAAAVTKQQTSSDRQPHSGPRDRSAVILGNGEAVHLCRQKLISFGISASHMENLPTRIIRNQGHFVALNPYNKQGAAAVVLIPKNSAEVQRLGSAFEFGPQRWASHPMKHEPDIRRPGVFYCDPSLDGSVTAAAAAAQVNAWLHNCTASPETNVAVVAAHRCRACNTCVETCEFGAPCITGPTSNRVSRIDPFLCTGCGTCAALCPSGAITAGYCTDAQLDRMIEALLSEDNGRYQKDKVVVYTCNWSAYSGLETAGLERRRYSSSVYPVKVMCLGRLGPGIILKTLEQGASGVLMLGCLPGECRYDFGSRRAEETFVAASDLLRKLGYSTRRLKMDRLAVGDGKTLTETIRQFVAALDGNRVAP